MDFAVALVVAVALALLRLLPLALVLVFTQPTHRLLGRTAAVMLMLVLAAEVHSVVLVAAETAHPARRLVLAAAVAGLQVQPLVATAATAEIQVVVVAVVVVQTATMTVAQVEQAVTHKSRFGYSDEMA
jgi:hypothetical protein